MIFDAATLAQFRRTQEASMMHECTIEAYTVDEEDGSISYDTMIERYNSDLANTFGNLVNRTVAMNNKYFTISTTSNANSASRHGQNAQIATKAAPVIISAHSSIQPIRLPHFRHFPRKTSQLTIGILSYHFSW